MLPNPSCPNGVHHRLRVREAVVAHAADHADDLREAVAAVADVDAAADRILTGEIALRERFVDDGDERRAVSIAIGEGAAAHQRDTERLEALSRNRPIAGVQLASRGLLTGGFPFNSKPSR